MALQEPDITHAHVDEVHETSLREPFSVGQIVAIAMGVFFIVTGGIGLARGGIESWTEPHVTVIGLGMTPSLAAIHIGLGVIAMLGAVSRLDARWSGAFLGAILIAGGIIALAEPVNALGWTDANGIAYIIIGAVAILAGAATPLIVRRDRHIH